MLAEAEKVLIPCHHNLLQCWVYPARGPTAVLCHGWQGSAASWATVIRALRSAGFRVVAFNAPGHHNRPVRSSLPLFTEALAKVATLFSADFLVGHSFGAMTTARVLAGCERIKAAVLYSAPDRLDTLAVGFCRDLGMSPSAHQDFLAKLQSTLTHPLHRETVSDYLRECRVPTLLIHDRDDRVVPIECSHRVKQDLGLELVETEKLGHRAIIRDEALAHRTVDFLLRNHSPR